MKCNLVLSPYPPADMGSYFNDADFWVLQYIMEYSPVEYQVSVCQKDTVRLISPQVVPLKGMYSLST